MSTEKNITIREDGLPIDIKVCYQCGKSHEDIKIYKLNKILCDYNYYYICSENLSPVLLKYIEGHKPTIKMFGMEDYI